MIEFNRHAIVKKYLGVPYKHHGREMDGLDCWGLVIRIYADYGIEIFDLLSYEREWARRGRNLILENYYDSWKRVDGDQKTGDVVLIKFPKDVVSHAGIVIDRVRFIQSIPQGTVLSPYAQWKDRIYGYYRYEVKNDIKNLAGSNRKTPHPESQVCSG